MRSVSRRVQRNRLIAALIVFVMAVLMAELVTWPSSPTVPPGRAQVAPVVLRSFTILGGGDILIHGPVADRARVNGQRSGRAYDFRPMFAPIKGIVSQADLAICHLEVPLSRDNSNITSYPSFNAPRQVAGGIRYTGFDACSTASNHALDKGESGVHSTLSVLDDFGRRHEGTARTAQGGRRPAIYEVNGVKVGHVSFTYGLNGYSIPDGKWWLVNVIKPDRIIKQARWARDHGAEFVVASLHFGVEYHRAPTSYQQDVARRVLSSPAVDAVLGHHAHVVQGITKVRKKFIAFGMGNQLSNQSEPADTQDGVMVKLVVEEREPGRFVVDRVRYTPTWVERGPYRILPVAKTLRAKWPSESLRQALRASWSRTVSAVRSLGRRDKVRPSSYPP